MNSLFRSAIVMAMILLFSKVSGLLRDVMIASQFGVSKETDAFFLAVILPVLLFAPIAESLRTAIIPTYTSIQVEKGEEEARNFVSSIAICSSLCALTLVLVGSGFSTHLARILASATDENMQQLTEQLLLILFPIVIFTALSSVCSALIQLKGKPYLQTYAGLVNNLLVIGVFFLFMRQWGIYGLAIATVCGTVGMSILHLVTLYQMKYRFRFSFYHKSQKSFFILALPIMLGMSLEQISLFTDRYLASFLHEGTISAIFLANRLSVLPYSIVAFAIGLIIYPQITQSAIRNNLMEYQQIITKGILLCNFLSVPIMIFFFLNSDYIIRIVYGYGAFDERAQSITTQLLTIYSVGIIAMCLREILMKGLYALKETRVTLYISMLGVGLNILMSVVFVQYFQAQGLALATSISYLVQVGGYLYVLKAKVSVFSLRTIIQNLGLLLAIASFACYFSREVIDFGSTYFSIAPFIETLVLLIMSSGSYLLICFLFKVKEVSELLSIVKVKTGNKVHLQTEEL